MSPRYFRDRLVRFWWLLLLCGVCAGIGGWIGGVLLFTVYSSTALIQVDLRVSAPTSSTMIVVDRLRRTSAQLSTSDSILIQVAGRYPGLSVAKLHSEVSSVSIANTQLVSVTVRDASSVRAASLASAIAEAVVAEQNRGITQTNLASQQPYITSLKTLSDNLTTMKDQLAALGQPPSRPSQAQLLQTQIEAAQSQHDLTQSTLSRIQAIESSEAMSLRIASPALPSATPVISHQIATTLAGVCFGFVLGVFLVVGSDWLNSRVQSPEVVAMAFQWARLGIPRIVQQGRSDTRASESVFDSVAAIARDIEFLGLDRPLRAIAFVSANPTDRTRELTALLASAYARNGRNTLLVDTHLRGGTQGAIFGIPSVPGLSDIILKSKNATPTAAGIMKYLHSPIRRANPYLRILPAGSAPPNPDRVLASVPCKQAIAMLVDLPAEITLFDASTALFGGDAESLRRVLDGVVILIDPGAARRGDLARLARALTESETPILGFMYLDDSAKENSAHAAEPGVMPESRLVGRRA